MILIAIVVATLTAGIGSVWLAAGLLRLGLRDAAPGQADAGLAGVGPQHLLSLAAGALLATAFMHLLPEAFESQAGAHELFATLLVGLVFFFLLDKAELWHHGHEHHHDVAPEPAEASARGLGHDHDHGHGHAHATGHTHDHGHEQPQGHGHAHAHAHAQTRAGGWSLLTGDSVHCFGDGVLIASAFVADWRLGAVAALSVLAHEVPHHIGDLVVLRQISGDDRRAALWKVSLAGAVTVLGGLCGYALVRQLPDGLPFLLAVASSSFIYVALADLIPQLQRRLSARQTLAQVAWLLAGMALVTLVSGVAHAH